MSENSISYDHETYMNKSRESLGKHILYDVYAFNGVLVIFGALGNVLVCLIVTRGKKMYTVPNLFLMNLAVADFCILVLGYPLWVLNSVLPNNWPFGPFLCKILFPLTDVFFGVSVGCMMAISVHRYRKIVHSKSRQMSFIHAKVVVIVLYAISILTISAPVYPIMDYQSFSANISSNGTSGTRCSWKYPSKTFQISYMLYLIVAWYLLPLVIMLCTFLRIKWYLLRRYRWMSESTCGRGVKPHLQGIKKALRLLIPVVIAYATLSLPWNVLRMVSVFEKPPYKIQLNKIFSEVASTLLVINSVVNPFIYYLASKDFRTQFRNGFRALLTILKLKKQGDGDSIFADTIDGLELERRPTGTIVRRASSKSSTGSLQTGGSKKGCARPSVVEAASFSNGATLPDFDEMFEKYHKGEYDVSDKVRNDSSGSDNSLKRKISTLGNHIRKVSTLGFRKESRQVDATSSDKVCEIIQESTENGPSDDSMSREEARTSMIGGKRFASHWSPGRSRSSSCADSSTRSRTNTCDMVLMEEDENECEEEDGTSDEERSMIEKFYEIDTRETDL